MKGGERPSAEGQGHRGRARAAAAGEERPSEGRTRARGEFKKHRQKEGRCERDQGSRGR